MIQDIGTVFAGEITRRIKSRPFLIGLVLGVVALLAITKLPSLLGNAFSGSNDVILVGDPALTARAKPLLSDGYTIKAILPPQTVSADVLKADKATAAIVIASNQRGLAVQVYTKDPGSFGRDTLAQTLLPLQLQLTMHRTATQVNGITAVPVNVETIGSKFASASQATAARGIAYMLLMFLYVLILVNSQLVTTSVAEEKTSRIAELLVASVDTSALLTGKVLSGMVLTLIQLAVWVGSVMLFSGGGSTASGQHDAGSIFALNDVLNVLSLGVLVAFLLFFVIGFLQLSTLMAAFASLINRTEDLGSINAPLVLPVVAALFIAIAALGQPDSQLAVAVSLIPILAPFVMFARIAASNVPIWQIGLSVAINLVALYLIALLAGKIYRVGMLLYGRPPKLSQIWHVLRT